MDGVEGKYMITCVLPLQAVSMRSAAYDLAWQYNVSNLQIYMIDNLHPIWLGHRIWADVMIYTFKKVSIMMS